MKSGVTRAVLHHFESFEEVLCCMLVALSEGHLDSKGKRLSMPVQGVEKHNQSDST